MISIIICARTEQLAESLLTNIQETIGVPFELIIIDNTKNELTIFQAYNLGVSKSKYPYLCFMHDDILFHTPDWGKAVCRHFEDTGVGAIGIGGCKYLSYMPGGWWSSGFYELNIIHSDKVENTAIVETVRKTGENKSEVTAVDGVWFCIPKKLFWDVKFDEVTFKGFHYYDLDICMQIAAKGYKIYVVFDVLIKHFSRGSINKSWLENALIFQHKWRAKLPASLMKLNRKDQFDLEIKVLSEFMNFSKGTIGPKETNKMAFNLLLRFRLAYQILYTPVLLLRFLRKSLIN